MNNDEINEITSTTSQKTIIKRPITGKLSSKKNNIFDPSLIDSATISYDIVRPNPENGDKNIKKINNGLVAFKNKAMKIQSKSNEKRPRSPSILSDVSQNVHSIIGSRPLTAFKRGIPNSIEVVKQEVEAERASLNFNDDPVAYFSKRKDGTGHRFIYLNYSRDRDDSSFSPYDLVKVPHSEIKPEYFTMSVNGVTRIQPDGDTEHVSLDRWAKDSSIYISIMKLKFFSMYNYWKPFRIWMKHVMKQHFFVVKNAVTSMPLMCNIGYIRTIFEISKRPMQQIIQQYHLPFFPHKKFTINSLRETEAENSMNIKHEYSIFLEFVYSLLQRLEKDIKNPQRLIVRDNEFSEIKRRNPNIEQLKVLEKKLEAEKNRRKLVVEWEIKTYASYIRCLDYYLLEELENSCSHCWASAEGFFGQEMASIFLIEVAFGQNGCIVFEPSKSDLINAISRSFDESLSIINQLPRIVFHQSLIESLKRIYNISRLIGEGASFSQFISSNSTFQTIKSRILTFVDESYQEAIEHSQMFKEYYSIYESGKKWNPLQYDLIRGGKSITFQFFHSVGDDGFIYNPSLQTIVDFNSIKRDIELFNRDEARMTQFPSCVVKGPLFVDSKNLKNELMPIPLKFLQSIKKRIDELFTEKVDFFCNMIKYCTKKLKKEPLSLSQFVDYCEFIQDISDLIPFLTHEISFIDGLLSINELFSTNNPSDADTNKNPLHDDFRKLKQDHNSAISTKELLNDKFIQTLQVSLREKEKDLQSIQTRVSSYPQTISNADTSIYLPEITSLLRKVDSMKPEIESLIHFQIILGIRYPDLSIFDVVQSSISYIEKVYISVSSWKNIKSQLSTNPFASINAISLCNEIEVLFDSAKELSQSSNYPSPLLKEISNNIQKLLPFIPQLQMLYNGKMQSQHWTKLFDECGLQGLYNPLVRIEDLIDLGILAEKEKIEVVTNNSKGESQLEADFQSIYMRWQEVHVPLLDSQQKSEDSLLLGNLDQLFSEINDTQIRLQTMLAIPFAEKINNSIIELSTRLDYYEKVFYAWAKFQGNWIIVSAFFYLEGTIEILPQQSELFGMIRRRWMSLVRFTLEKSTLVHVCSFPSLLELLSENNTHLENIISSVVPFLNHKRFQLPRLFFLSNQEVLSLFSTTDFSIFSLHLSKLFMGIKRFDSHTQESSDNSSIKVSNHQNFSKLTIYGMVGDNSDSLTFKKSVHCTISIEAWVSNLIQTMKDSVLISIIDSVRSYSTLPIFDWIMTVPTYVAIIALNSVFVHDINECFHISENNPRSFSNYESQISQRIQDISNSFLSPLTPGEVQKISSIISILNSQMLITKELSEKVLHYSQRVNWSNHLKIRLNEQKTKIYVEFGDNSIEFGYEYWGSVVPFIYSQSSKKLYLNIFSSIMNSHIPYLYGQYGGDKSQIINTVGALFGAYIFSCPPLSFGFQISLDQVLLGACLNGSWLTFYSSENQSIDNLCLLYDRLFEYKKGISMQSNKIRVNNHSILINKGTRILLLGNSSKKLSQDMPSHLLAFLKPISVVRTDVSTILDIKLSSQGFKSSKYLVPKMIQFHNTISSLSSSFPLISTIKSLHKIINDAVIILRDLIQSQDHRPINYYESTRAAEEYSIAYSFYFNYYPRLQEVDSSPFLTLLYNHFHFVDNLSIFSNLICNSNMFVADKIDKIIKDSFVDLNPLKSYLALQCMQLNRMLISSDVVIVYGGPKSGKSTIVEMLVEFCSKSTNDNISITNTNRKINVFDFFFGSDDITNVFGNFTNDLYHFGHIHSVFHQLYSSNPTNLNIIRFNGTITPETAKNIKTIFQFQNISSIKLLTLDSFYIGNNVKIIFETDSVSNIDPSFLANCSVLYMNNIFTIKNCFYPLDHFSLSNPSVLFDEFSNHCILNSKTMSILKDLFIEIAPVVIDFVFHIQNNVFSIFDFSQRDRSVLLLHDLPICALRLTTFYIDYSGIDANPLLSLKTILVLSFFMVYRSIIDQNQMNAFDTWIRSNFMIEIPADWVSFNVPDHFWDIYPRPSLLSMRYYKGKLIPLDYSVLFERPIIKSHLDYPNTVFCEDIIVCHAQYLPILFETTMLIRNKVPFILHGSRLSGKSSLLQYIFRNSSSDSIIPIYIELTHNSSRDSIIQFLKNHTDIFAQNGVIKKTYKVYSLVFENLSSCNGSIIEFIREIITTKSIKLFNEKDPKYFGTTGLINCFVVVTTTSLKEFSARFLTHFVPIYVIAPTSRSIKFIFETIARTTGISQKIIDPIYNLYDGLLSKGYDCFHYSHMLQVLSLIESRHAKTDQSYLMCVRTVLSEVQFLSFNGKGSLQDIRPLFNSIFNSEKFKSLFELLLNGKDMFYSEIAIGLDNQTINVNINKHQRKEITDYLNVSLNENYGDTNLVFTNPTVNLWSFIQRALSYPGGNIALIGKSGSGKASIVKFTSKLKGYKFIDIGEASQGTIIKSYISENIFTAVQTSKPIVFFVRGSNSKAINYLEPLYRYGDVTPFYDEHMLDSFYTKLCAIHSIPKMSRIDSHLVLKECVRQFVHFVFAFDEDIGTFSYPNFYRIWFDVSKSSSLKKIASSLLSPTKKLSTIGPAFNSLPSVFVQIFEKVESMSKLTHINHYYDFLRVFVSTIINDSIRFNTNIENLNLVISFVKNIESRYSDLDTARTRLNGKLEDINSKGILSSSELIEQKRIIQIQLTSLEDDERLKTAELNRMKDEQNNLQNSISELKTQIISSKQALDNLKTEDIESIKSISQSNTPHPYIVLIIQIVLVFLKQNPVFETNGRRLLSDNNLISVITSQIDPDSIELPVIERARILIEDSISMQASDVYKISIPLSIIYKWINSIYLVYDTQERLKALSSEIEMKESSLNSSFEKNYSEKEKLMVLLQNFESQIELVQTSNANKEQIEKELTLTESQIRSIDALYKGLDVLLLEWKDMLIQNEKNIDSIIGNSIIWSSYIALMGSFTFKERANIISSVLSILKENMIEVNSISPIDEITNRFEISFNNDFRLSKDPLYPKEFCYDLAFIFCTQRTPLIIDPDGIVPIQLTKWIKEIEIVSTSIYSSQFFEKMLYSMQNGLVLILFDVDFLHPFLYQLLSNFLMNKQQRIEINSKIIIKHSAFKLFLFSPSNVKKDLIPIQLFSITTVVDFSATTLMFVESKILNTIVSFFDPDIVPRISSCEKSDEIHQIDMKQYQNTTFDLIVKIIKKYPMERLNYFLNDDNLMGDLMRSKECYFAAVHVTTTTPMIMNEFSVTIETMRVYINHCLVLWIAISRYLGKISPEYQYSFFEFLGIIENALLSSGIPHGSMSIPNPVLLKNSITKCLLRYIMPSLRSQHALFMLFIIGYLIQYYDNKASTGDYEVIINHFAEELESKCDFTPIDTRKGDPFDQLKFSNIANIFPFFIRFIQESVGSEFLNCFSSFVLDNFVSDKPTIIQCNHNYDISSLLSIFVVMKDSLKSYHSFSVPENSSLFDNLKQKVLLAKDSGEWVSLHMSNTNSESINFITELIEDLKNREGNSGFRLIIITSFSFKTTLIIRNECSRLVYEDFPFVKTQMQSLFNHFSSVIDTNSRLSRKMIYAITLIYSLIRFRSIFYPIGFSSQPILSEIDIYEAITFINRHSESLSIPIRNIRDFLNESIFSRCVMDQYDRRKIKTLVYSIITPDLYDDGFVFIDSQSSELDKWTINPDFHNADRIPLFNSGDPLLMNPYISNHLKDYYLSKWVLQSFVIPHGIENTNVSTMDNATKSIINSLPNYLKIEIDLFTPIMKYLFEESKSLNQTIFLIRETLANKNFEVISSIVKGKVPTLWKNSMNFYGTNKITRFIIILNERARAYAVWMKHGTILSPFSSNLISNFKGLFNSFLCEIARQRNSSVDMLNYDYKIGDLEQESTSNLVITNMALIGANWDSINGKFVHPNAKTHSISKLPPLNCIVGKRENKSVHTFSCPVYQDMEQNIDTMIASIPLETEISEKLLVSSGASITCHSSDEFL